MSSIKPKANININKYLKPLVQNSTRASFVSLETREHTTLVPLVNSSRTSLTNRLNINSIHSATYMTPTISEDFRSL